MYYRNKRFNNYTKKKKEFGLNDIENDHQLTKFFLALYFNEFAFEWQLTKKFNLTKSQVQKYTEKLDELGLISFRLLSDLSLEMQEAILTVTPDSKKIWDLNPKIIVITPFAKKDAKFVIENIIKKANTHPGLYDTLKEILSWSNAYREVKKKIQHENNTLLGYRKINLPNGLIIEHPTKKYLDLKIELKTHTTGTSLVKSSEDYNLMLREVKKELLEERKEYKGIYSYMTAQELETLINNQDIDEKQLKKQEEKEIKEKIKNMQEDKYYNYLLGKSDYRDKLKIEKEAELFLDSLQPGD